MGPGYSTWRLDPFGSSFSTINNLRIQQWLKILVASNCQHYMNITGIQVFKHYLMSHTKHHKDQLVNFRNFISHWGCVRPSHLLHICTATKAYANNTSNCKSRRMSCWYTTHFVGRCCLSAAKPRPDSITPALAGALSASMASSSA